MKGGLTLGAGVFVAIAHLACGDGRDVDSGPPAQAAAPSADASGQDAVPPNAPELSACDDRGARFGDLEWLPQSRFSLLLDRSAEQLVAVLKKVRRDAGAPVPEGEAQLPIYARFELQQLDLELRSLDLVLAGLDLHPDELLKVHGPENAVIWFVPARCDYAALESRAQQRWGVRFRSGLDSRIGPAPEAGALPYDLLLLSGERLALAPRGRARDATRWLKGERLDLQGAAGPPPGQEIRRVNPAPLLLRLHGTALAADSAQARMLAGEIGGLAPATARKAQAGEPDQE